MSIFDYKNNFKEIEGIPCELAWESSDCPSAPEVSIIMPVYTNHDYFRIALKSALEQDWTGSYEIVVVDNDTAENNPNLQIIEEFNDPRVRYFRNAENIGMIGNWNRGILKARAPFITFLHDDDMFMPETLSVGMETAAKYPDKLVIAARKLIDVNGKTWNDDSEYELTRRLLFFKQRPVSKVSFARSLCLDMGNCEGDILNREDCLSLGGFNPQAYPIPDYEFLVRYCYRFGAVYLRRPTLLYRFADNTSYKVYSSIASTQRKIAEDMIDKIWLPKWISRKIADTYCKLVDTNFRRSFAPTEHQAHHKISFIDRFITSAYINVHNLIEGYKLSIIE